MNKPGRPRGSYKYADRALFEAHLRIAIRACHKLPSHAMIAHALDIDPATLDTTLERFGLTDDVLHELAADRNRRNNELIVISETYQSSNHG